MASRRFSLTSAAAAESQATVPYETFLAAVEAQETLRARLDIANAKIMSQQNNFKVMQDSQHEHTRTLQDLRRQLAVVTEANAALRHEILLQKSVARYSASSASSVNFANFSGSVETSKRIMSSKKKKSLAPESMECVVHPDVSSASRSSCQLETDPAASASTLRKKQRAG